MHLLVTRPQPQADRWVADLQARGIDAVAFPLIAIAPAPDPAAVAAAWQALPAASLAVFVSPNAVDAFFAQRPAGASWPPALRAAAPGPGSADELRGHGVPAVVAPPADAPQLDSESLWRALSADPWDGTTVLVVRGDGGREWLADQLRSRGADVKFVQAYARTVPTLDDAQRDTLARALADPTAHTWHFSSSQAIDHLARLAPDAQWSTARAIASHPRIASRARAAGFGHVQQAAPTPDAIVAALQHAPLQSSAP